MQSPGGPPRYTQNLHRAHRGKSAGGGGGGCKGRPGSRCSRDSCSRSGLRSVGGTLLGVAGLLGDLLAGLFAGGGQHVLVDLELCVDALDAVRVDVRAVQVHPLEGRETRWGRAAGGAEGCGGKRGAGGGGPD